MNSTGKVACIVTVAALASAAALYGARDGGGPPRDRTRAEASLSTVRVTRIAPPAAHAPVSDATARGPALTITELEQKLATSEPGARDLVLDAALPAMVTKNPREIARFAELQTDAHLRELLFRQVAQRWTTIDADQAMAWARSLPDPSERDAALVDVSLSVALTDPRRAVSLHEQQVGNIESDGVLEGLVQQWAQKDFDAAVAWTNGRPAGEQRDQLIQRLAYVQAARGQPAMAARLVHDSIHSPEARTAALATVAQQAADARHISTDF